LGIVGEARGGIEEDGKLKGQRERGHVPLFGHKLLGQKKREREKWDVGIGSKGVKKWST